MLNNDAGFAGYLGAVRNTPHSPTPLDQDTRVHGVFECSPKRLLLISFLPVCCQAPPPGHREHRYIFCVSALPVDELPITPDVSPAICNFNMFGAGVLGRGILTAKFGR